MTATLKALSDAKFGSEKAEKESKLDDDKDDKVEDSEAPEFQKDEGNDMSPRKGDGLSTPTNLVCYVALCVLDMSPAVHGGSNPIWRSLPTILRYGGRVQPPHGRSLRW